MLRARISWIDRDQTLRFAGQVTPCRLNVNFTGNATANVNADDLGFAIPQYVFAQPMLGGQAAVAMVVAAGHSRASVDASLMGKFSASAGRASEWAAPAPIR
jgi:hypothetical protein